MEDILTSALSEKHNEKLLNTIKELKDKINQNRTDVTQIFKSEIKRLLEQEITFHYRLMQGQMEYLMARDKQVLEARKVLGDLARYHKLLSTN